MTLFKQRGLADRSRQDELLKVAEQAAAWLIELDEGGAAERAACAAWLAESPLHVEMFLRASSVDRMTELMAPEDVKALAQKNRHADRSVLDFSAAPVGVLRDRDGPATLHSASLSALRRLPLLRARMRNGRLRFAGIAAGVLALIAGGIWYESFGPGSWDSYETTVGEQRVVSLADGSMIYVNTDSRVDVRYTDNARNVRLRDGEALFNVARDAKRPFRVHVGEALVQAVGTEFNIYRRAGGVKVSVVEGVVQVSQASAAAMSEGKPGAQHLPTESAGSAEHLAAGQGVSLRQDGALEKPVAVNISQVTAWRERRLVFEWQTLEEIAAEFNRYNRTPRIRVEGAAIGKRRYTAVFDADNPQALLRFLSKDENLKFAAEGDDFVIRSR